MSNGWDESASAWIAHLGERGDAIDSRHQIWFEGAGWTDTPIYRREFLPLGPGLAGPAIVEQLDTTIVVPPGAQGETDRFGNLIVTVPAAGRDG